MKGVKRGGYKNSEHIRYKCFSLKFHQHYSQSPNWDQDLMIWVTDFKAEDLKREKTEENNQYRNDDLKHVQKLNLHTCIFFIWRNYYYYSLFSSCPSSNNLTVACRGCSILSSQQACLGDYRQWLFKSKNQSNCNLLFKHRRRICWIHINSSITATGNAPNVEVNCNIQHTKQHLPPRTFPSYEPRH